MGDIDEPADDSECEAANNEFGRPDVRYHKEAGVDI
jgi:hypothetical protein